MRYSLLFSALPATMTGPCSPPFIAASRLLRSKSESLRSALWHEEQLFSRMGLMSPAKVTAGDVDAVGPGACARRSAANNPIAAVTRRIEGALRRIDVLLMLVARKWNATRLSKIVSRPGPQGHVL